MFCKSFSNFAFSSLIISLLVGLTVIIYLISSHPKIDISLKCKFGNGTTGICVKNAKCFIQEEFIGLHIDDGCATSDFTCCQQKNILPDGVKDFEIHKNFKHFKNQKCGILAHPSHNSIHQIHDSKFPWIVSLGHINNHSHLKFTCGGSLISDKYILTSAQCVTTLESGYKLSVIRLKYNRNSRSEDEDHLDIKQFEVISHPKFDPISLDNDIALIKLDTAVNLDYYEVTPICLPLDKDVEIPFELTSIGRKARNSKRRSRVLVYQTSANECERKIRQLSNDSDPDMELQSNKYVQNFQANFKINENKFCVEKEVIDNNCKTESGMSLQSHLTLKTGSLWTQYGVLSHDSSCSLPSFYINVQKYLRWIFDNVDQ